MSYLRALRYSGHSIHHFSLRTYRETLPPFTLPVEMVPVLKGPMSSLGMAIKLLSQDYSWIPVI